MSTPSHFEFIVDMYNNEGSISAVSAMRLLNKYALEIINNDKSLSESQYHEVRRLNASGVYNTIAKQAQKEGASERELRVTVGIMSQAFKKTSTDLYQGKLDSGTWQEPDRSSLESILGAKASFGQKVKSIARYLDEISTSGLPISDSRTYASEKRLADRLFKETTYNDVRNAGLEVNQVKMLYANLNAYLAKQNETIEAQRQQQLATKSVSSRPSVTEYASNAVSTGKRLFKRLFGKPAQQQYA